MQRVDRGLDGDDVDGGDGAARGGIRVPQQQLGAVRGGGGATACAARYLRLFFGLIPKPNSLPFDQPQKNYPAAERRNPHLALLTHSHMPATTLRSARGAGEYANP